MTTVEWIQQIEEKKEKAFYYVICNRIPYSIIKKNWLLCSYRNVVDMFFLLGLKVGQKVLRQPKCEFVEKSRANFTLSCTFSSYICQRNELENGGKKSYSRSHKAHRGWNSKNQHSNFGAKNSNRFENIFFLAMWKSKMYETFSGIFKHFVLENENFSGSR